VPDSNRLSFDVRFPGQVCGQSEILEPDLCDVRYPVAKTGLLFYHHSPKEARWGDPAISLKATACGLQVMQVQDRAEFIGEVI
jgi:hypothetical protein